MGGLASDGAAALLAAAGAVVVQSADGAVAGLETDRPSCGWSIADNSSDLRLNQLFCDFWFLTVCYIYAEAHFFVLRVNVQILLSYIFLAGVYICVSAIFSLPSSHLISNIKYLALVHTITDLTTMVVRSLVHMLAWVRIYKSLIDLFPFNTVSCETQGISSLLVKRCEGRVEFIDQILVLNATQIMLVTFYERSEL